MEIIKWFQLFMVSARETSYTLAERLKYSSVHQRYRSAQLSPPRGALQVASHAGWLVLSL